MNTPLTISVCVCIAMFSATAIAQSGRSSMNGLVLDESDTHGIENATVELIGDPTNQRLKDVKLSTKTDSRGKYLFERVPYGDYTFRVSAPEFTTYQVTIYLASDAQTQLHAKLRKKQQ